jgi:hypothetical protein
LEKEARQAADAKASAEAAELAEYNRLKEERELENIFAGEGETFASIDPEDARKLAKPLYEKLAARQDARLREIQERVRRQEETLNQQARGAQESAVKKRVFEFQTKLAAAVPDIQQVIRTPGYKEFMSAPAQAGSVISTQDFLNQELLRGNVDYVVERIRRHAVNKPSLETVAQVSSVTTGVTAPVTPVKKEGYNEMKTRLEQRRTGIIKSGAEYRAAKKGTGLAMSTQVN